MCSVPNCACTQTTMASSVGVTRQHCVLVGANATSTQLRAITVWCSTVDIEIVLESADKRKAVGKRNNTLQGKH